MFLVDDVSDGGVVSDASEEMILPQFAPRLKETKAPKKPKAEKKKGKIRQNKEKDAATATVKKLKWTHVLQTFLMDALVSIKLAGGGGDVASFKGSEWTKVVARFDAQHPEE